jgi:hypothetical protein
MKRIRDLLGLVVEPFRSGDRLDPALVVVFFVLNGLVLLNACLHDPRFGYDAHEHLRYLRTLSGMRLVTLQDSQEFFSPPLPYFLPALLMLLTGTELFAAAKFAQFQNVALSIAVTFYVLRTCQLISSKCSLRLGALLFIAIFRTFSFGNAAKLGVAMGLCALSRQWGILSIPAICLFLMIQWIRLREWRTAVTRTLVLSLTLAVVIAGWFYA